MTSRSARATTPAAPGAARRAQRGGAPTAAPQAVTQPRTPSQTVLLTAAQVGARWQVRDKHVLALARAGDLPHVRIGKYVRFRMEAIQQWERDQEEATHA
jgi:excisionase family DNA binding protein